MRERTSDTAACAHTRLMTHTVRPVCETAHRLLKQEFMDAIKRWFVKMDQTSAT